MARRAEARAAQLLADCGVFSPPVNVERLVRHQGAMVSRSSFKDGDVSGMLLRRDGQSPVIGVNDSQPPCVSASLLPMSSDTSCCTRGARSS